jgi:hypothetical protein
MPRGAIKISNIPDGWMKLKTVFSVFSGLMFWADPFTPEGAKLMQRLLPAARDIRLGAEHALEVLYRSRSKARMNSDTLGDMEVAAWRFDTLGMKIQFTEEINKFY